MMAKRALVLALLALLAEGCLVYRKPNQKAAARWIETPPEKIEEEGVEARRIDGYRVLWLSTGAFGGGGPHWPKKTGKRTGNANAGVEATVALCPRSMEAFPHLDHELPRVALPTGPLFGLNLGLTVVERRGGVLGPAYVEAQLAISLPMGLYTGFAAGWAADFDDRRHGPQVTWFGGPFYMRFIHMVQDRTDLVFGLTLKLPLLFAWEV